jgi:hypothetical protein
VFGSTLCSVPDAATIFCMPVTSAVADAVLLPARNTKSVEAVVTANESMVIVRLTRIDGGDRAPATRNCGSATVPMSTLSPTRKNRICTAVVAAASCTTVVADVVPHVAILPSAFIQIWRLTSRLRSVVTPSISEVVWRTKLPRSDFMARMLGPEIWMRP